MDNRPILRSALLIGILLLLFFWLTRIPALEALPLHNDEGLHLRRAVEVWSLHPFFDISDGKIINHWLIAAFYPQNAPVFVGRIATLLVSLLALAAGYALLMRTLGFAAALLGSIFWITSSYLFFFERIAFSDSQAGALIALAVYFALRLRQTGKLRDAILTGMAFSAAVLFKFTAAPYGLTILLLLCWDVPRRLVRDLVVLALVGAACFMPVFAYLLLTGRDFFGIALAWVFASGGGDTTFVQNGVRFIEQWGGFGSGIPFGLALVGLLALPLARPHGLRLLLAYAAPLLVILLLGNDIQPRHYVVALPLGLLLAGGGWARLLMLLNTAPNDKQAPRWAAAALALVLLGVFVPFAREAYSSPATLPLPDLVRRAHITEFSAGYGLREALRDLPNHAAPEDSPVIGSMYPDSCRRANFYAVHNYLLLCGDAPMRAAVDAALAERGSALVLVENAGVIGIAPADIAATATRIAAYPRPGETQETASVVLWRFTAP